MEPFKPLHAVAAPIPLSNIDTDQIIPARFLWRKRDEGWGDLLFHDLRFQEDGSPRPDFVLNREPYRGARIVVAERNFGCGSSREQAVWALYDYGVRAVIAPSFGDIFFNNSLQNGLLPVVLPSAVVADLLATLAGAPGMQLAVDLASQTVLTPAPHAFAIDPFRKHCLLTGVDALGLTLGLDAEIAAFEADYARTVSWL